MGPEKFARQIKLFKPGSFEYDVEKATSYREGFFKTYPAIPERMKRLRNAWQYKEIRNFKTISGRYRHFKDEYVAAGKILNSEIQGSAADLLKVCMFIISKFVLPKYPGTRFLLQVHDEVVLAVPKRFSREVGILVKYVLEYPWFDMAVPVLASAKLCTRWSDNSNDRVPEIGTVYAELDGVPRTFTYENWDEWAHAQENKKIKITNKSAAAHLTEADKDFCRTVIPDKGPYISTGSGGARVVSRLEELASRNQ